MSTTRSISIGFRPSRASSALTKRMSNSALWMTNGASPTKERKSSTTSANVGLSLSAVAVWPCTHGVVGNVTFWIDELIGKRFPGQDLMHDLHRADFERAMPLEGLTPVVSVSSTISRMMVLASFETGRRAQKLAHLSECLVVASVRVNDEMATPSFLEIAHLARQDESSSSSDIPLRAKARARWTGSAALTTTMMSTAASPPISSSKGTSTTTRRRPWDAACFTNRERAGCDNGMHKAFEAI